LIIQPILILTKMTALLIGRLMGSHNSYIHYTKLNSNTYYKHITLYLRGMGCQILIIIITPVHHVRTTV
jgi:hypothetical protein